MHTSPFAPTIASFGRWLCFANKSDNTVTIYVGAAQKLADWITQQSDDIRVTTWAAVTPEHIRDFIISILETRSAGYANNLFHAIQQFFKWWAAEEDAPNPMAGMSAFAVYRYLQAAV